MIRRIGALAAVVIAASALVAPPAVAQDADASDAPATTVRIQARKVESGKVEFGLQLDGDSEWLPRARLFPYPTAEVGRWLFSSPYTMSDGTTVRIQARLLANGKLEFGLQLNGEQVWLPRARYFPYDMAAVGRWLLSSVYTAGGAGGVATPPAVTGPDNPPSAPRTVVVAAVVCDVQGGLHSVRLEWKPPHSDGGSAVTGYSVSRLRATELGFTPEIPDPALDTVVSGTSFVGSDVLQSELYEWSIQAINSAGRSEPATVRFIYRPRYSPVGRWDLEVRHTYCDELVRPLSGVSGPSAPRELQAWWSDTDGQVRISWEPPIADGGDRITSYHVAYSDAGSTSLRGGLIFPALRRESYSTGRRAVNLSPGEVRRYWVAAINSRGVGSWASVDFSFTNVPSEPQNLRLRVLCDSENDLKSALFEWDSPASDGGSPITTYSPQVWNNPLWFSWHPVSTTSLAIETYLGYLLNEQDTVSLLVRAHNANGPGNFAVLEASLGPDDCSKEIAGEPPLESPWRFPPSAPAGPVTPPGGR